MSAGIDRAGGPTPRDMLQRDLNRHAFRRVLTRLTAQMGRNQAGSQSGRGADRRRPRASPPGFSRSGNRL